jgi:hypothetical protein
MRRAASLLLIISSFNGGCASSNGAGWSAAIAIVNAIAVGAVNAATEMRCPSVCPERETCSAETHRCEEVRVEESHSSEHAADSNTTTSAPKDAG